MPWIESRTACRAQTRVPRVASGVLDRNGDGDPWWVAKDVCDVLALNNVSQALTFLDEDEKQQLGTNIINNDVGGRGTLVVNEPGLYSLILRSRKPQAKAFKRWITHEVIPFYVK